MIEENNFLNDVYTYIISINIKVIFKIKIHVSSHEFHKEKIY